MDSLPILSEVNRGAIYSSDKQIVNGSNMKKCIIIVAGLLICTLALANSATAKSPGNIFEVQKKLLMLGYSPGPADGMMGHRTEEAIRRFQQDNGLPPTGRVDRHTEEIIMRNNFV